MKKLGIMIKFYLKTAYAYWMKLAFVLGWVNTRIILFAIFYLVFTPISIALKLFRIDLLERKIDKSAGSYWKKEEPAPAGYERQF